MTGDNDENEDPRRAAHLRRWVYESGWNAHGLEAVPGMPAGDEGIHVRGMLWISAGFATDFLFGDLEKVTLGSMGASLTTQPSFPRAPRGTYDAAFYRRMIACSLEVGRRVRDGWVFPTCAGEALAISLVLDLARAQRNQWKLPVRATWREEIEPMLLGDFTPGSRLNSDIVSGRCQPSDAWFRGRWQTPSTPFFDLDEL